MEKAKKSKKMSKKTRDTLVGYSFISIWIIGFLLFMLLPIINSAIYSFSVVHQTKNGFKLDPVGFQNYVNIFKHEYGF